MILVLLAAVGACATAGDAARDGDAAPVRKAIEAQYHTMEEAFRRGDAEAIAAIYTDDAAWYVPEARVIAGQAAIARAWKALVGPGGNSLRVDVDEVERAGDRAHEIGRFTISAPNGSVLGAGKYLVIWKQQDDGSWKTYRDIFNWDIPPERP